MNAKDFDFKTIAILFVIVIAIGIGVNAVKTNINETTASCTVISKDRTTNQDGGSDMRVYTKECGTLKIEDMISKGDFSSSDRFGSLQENKTYTMTYAGFRIPFLSIFPVITDIKM